MPSMLQELIDSYGYAAVLIGTLLEGETILLLGGLAAKLGYLKLFWVIVVGFVGATLGDQFWFYIGRRHGQALLARHPRWRQRVERIHHILVRFETALLLGFRFLYGLRNLTPLVIGTSKISWRKFVLLNITGALIWAVTIGTLGYAFGQGIDLLLGNVKHYELEAVLFLTSAGLAVWVVHLVARRLRRGS